VNERRVPYFERPAPPHDWRWKVALVGRTLITLGLLMFAFVAYQLWGTGIQTAQAQHTLDHQFATELAGTTPNSSTSTPTSTTVPSSTSSVSSTTSTTSTTTTVPTAPVAPAPTNGTAVARLKITSIGLTYTVVQGVGVADLKKGPGHFPETPMPGQYGNAAIAGHRTTYGHPFYKLDKVKVGDLIEVDTLVGKYTYAVTGSRVVSPEQYSEVIPTVDHTVATLTLATCTPAYTARQRLIVFATLVADQSDTVYAPSALGTPSGGGLPGDAPSGTTNTTTSSAPAITQPDDGTPGAVTTTATGVTTTTTTTTTAASTTGSTTGTTNTTPVAATDAFSSGWFDDGSAIPHVLVWGLLLVVVCLGAFRVGKKANRLWVSIAVGAVPFLVVLYFFFENVNRLLPSSI
jgi:sortase A